jgi:hypothetical protein
MTFGDLNMKRNYIKAYNALKKIGVPVYVRDDMDGRFQISAEEPDSYKWVNHYQYPSNWDFGVHPKIDQILRENGLFCEWINGGELAVCQA